MMPLNLGWGGEWGHLMLNKIRKDRQAAQDSREIQVWESSRCKFRNREAIYHLTETQFPPWIIELIMQSCPDNRRYYEKPSPMAIQ